MAHYAVKLTDLRPVQGATTLTLPQGRYRHSITNVPYDSGYCAFFQSDASEVASSDAELQRAHAEFSGSTFGRARSYFVSTVDHDETTIREYIRNQEVGDKRLDQLRMWK